MAAKKSIKESIAKSIKQINENFKIDLITNLLIISIKFAMEIFNKNNRF